MIFDLKLLRESYQILSHVRIVRAAGRRGVPQPRPGHSPAAGVEHVEEGTVEVARQADDLLVVRQLRGRGADADGNRVELARRLQSAREEEELSVEFRRQHLANGAAWQTETHSVDQMSI